MHSNYRDREEWRDIPGFVGSYQVSSTGRVLSVERTIIRSNGINQRIRQRLVKQRLSNRGKAYMLVTIADKGVMHTFLVHRLVALAFIGPRPPGMHIAHMDGNGGNNAVTNLRYVTPLENESHKRFCPRCGLDVRDE